MKYQDIDPTAPNYKRTISRDKAAWEAAHARIAALYARATINAMETFLGDTPPKGNGHLKESDI